MRSGSGCLQVVQVHILCHLYTLLCARRQRAFFQRSFAATQPAEEPRAREYILSTLYDRGRLAETSANLIDTQRSACAHPILRAQTGQSGPSVCASTDVNKLTTHTQDVDTHTHAHFCPLCQSVPSSTSRFSLSSPPPPLPKLIPPHLCNKDSLVSPPNTPRTPFSRPIMFISHP
jgi:hypothetical protein